MVTLSIDVLAKARTRAQSRTGFKFEYVLTVKELSGACELSAATRKDCATWRPLAIFVQRGGKTLQRTKPALQDENGLVRWNSQPLKLYASLCPKDGVATAFEPKVVRVVLLMYCSPARGLRLATHDFDLGLYSSLCGNEKRSQGRFAMQPTADLSQALRTCKPDLSHCVDVPPEDAALCQVLDDNDDDPEELDAHASAAMALAEHSQELDAHARAETALADHMNSPKSERPRDARDATLARAQSQQAEESLPCADSSKWHHRLRCEEAACSRSFWFGGRHHCRRCGVSVCSEHFARPLCVRCSRKTI